MLLEELVPLREPLGQRAAGLCLAALREPRLAAFLALLRALDERLPRGLLLRGDAKLRLEAGEAFFRRARIGAVSGLVLEASRCVEELFDA